MPDLTPLQAAGAEFNLSRVSLPRYLAEGRLTRYRAVGDRKTYVDREELRELTAPKPVVRRQPVQRRKPKA